MLLQSVLSLAVKNTWEAGPCTERADIMFSWMEELCYPRTGLAAGKFVVSSVAPA